MDASVPQGRTILRMEQLELWPLVAEGHEVALGTATTAGALALFDLTPPEAYTQVATTGRDVMAADFW